MGVGAAATRKLPPFLAFPRGKVPSEARRMRAANIPTASLPIGATAHVTEAAVRYRRTDRDGIALISLPPREAYGGRGNRAITRKRVPHNSQERAPPSGFPDGGAFSRALSFTDGNVFSSHDRRLSHLPHSFSVFGPHRSRIQKYLPFENTYKHPSEPFQPHFCHMRRQHLQTTR